MIKYTLLFTCVNSNYDQMGSKISVFFDQVDQSVVTHPPTQSPVMLLGLDGIMALLG